MKDMTTEILVLANKETEAGEDLDPDVVHVGPKRGCCFWIPCFSSQRPTRGKGSLWWERIRTADRKDRWWLKEWRKVRVSGPRWKAFIRRFKKSNGRGRGARLGKFHYDPLSYARNFNEGPGQYDHLDDDIGYRHFSSRFASIPYSAKSSMDPRNFSPAFHVRKHLQI